MNFEDYLTKSYMSYPDTLIREAMIYSSDGGKRFRPNIIFSIVKGFGLDEEVAYPAAAGLEYIQTASLIHDDLPGMDNDNYRRGKLSTHAKYGQGIGILTGDVMFLHSFSCIVDANYDDELKVNLISTLAKYSGLYGMCYGQLLDLKADSKVTKEELFALQDNKTSGLFKIACLFAMYLADNKDYKYFEKLGSMIGIVFQNQDDLFDIIKSEEETGKSNSDVRNDKITALSFQSIEELKESIKKQFDDLFEYLKNAPFDTKYLLDILNKMAKR